MGDRYAAGFTGDRNLFIPGAKIETVPNTLKSAPPTNILKGNSFDLTSKKASPVNATLRSSFHFSEEYLISNPALSCMTDPSGLIGFLYQPP